MYSKFSELIIGKDSIVIETNDGREYIYDYDIDVDEYRNLRCQLLDDGIVEIKIDNRWIYINDSLNDIKWQIFLPYDVRVFVDKDLRQGNPFKLSYRQHLRQVYSKKEMTVVNMNYIPDTVYEKVENAQEKTEKYSQGKANKPVLILFHNEVNDNLHYSIMKDSTIVESGVL